MKALPQPTPSELSLWPASTVSDQLQWALTALRPLSLVRLGDGETLTLAHGVLLTPEEAQRRGPFLSYAGVNLPDFSFRDRLVRSIQVADIVGITTSPGSNFMPLLLQSLEAHGIDLSGRAVTDATINYTLHQEGYLDRLLLGRWPRPRLLLVGNRMEELDPILRLKGCRVVRVVAPVKGSVDVDRILSIVDKTPFELALISAGIPAVVLAVETAQRTGRVAIDFGHLADELISGAKVMTAPPPPTSSQCRWWEPRR